MDEKSIGRSVVGIAGELAKDSGREVMEERLMPRESSSAAELYRNARTVMLGVAVFSLALHSVGYLTMRFRFQSYGLDPEFSVISETFLFEGARHLLFLLSLLPPLLFTTAPVTLPLLLLAAIPAVRSRAGASWGRLLQWQNGLPRALIALVGFVWASFFLRVIGKHVAEIDGVVFGGLPCAPPWIRRLALERSIEETSLVYGALFLALWPTAWAARRLLASKSWVIPGAMLAGLGVTQLLLIPIFFAVLVGPQWASRVEGLDFSDQDDLASGQQVWLFASDEGRHWFIQQDPEAPRERKLLVRERRETTALNIVEQRPLFELLDQGHGCGD